VWTIRLQKGGAALMLDREEAWQLLDAINVTIHKCWKRRRKGKF
jgi:hypothetical protein